MKNKLCNLKSAWRISALAAAFALVGAAQADLKMSVSVNVTGSGAKSAGLPKAGQYEVDFRAGQARIDSTGSTMIFDFAESKVAVLDTTAKTYYIETIANILTPQSKPSSAPKLNEDTATDPESVFGTNAWKFSISVPPATATATNAKAVSATVQSAQPGNVGKFSGSAWIADGSAVASSVGSVSPLVLIGAPREYAASLTQTLNQEAGIPVFLSFSWSSLESGKTSVEMTVNSIETTPLNDESFLVPADYKLAEKPPEKSGK